MFLSHSVERSSRLLGRLKSTKVTDAKIADRSNTMAVAYRTNGHSDSGILCRLSEY